MRRSRYVDVAGTRFAVAVGAISLIGPAYAQIADRLTLGSTCSYLGELVPETVTTFESNQEADSVIADIVEASGLAKNFTVRAAGVPNAAAVIEGSTRFILYSTSFIRNLESSTGSRWAATSILAHEIGHHLNGHTLDDRGSRPDIELEADYFSGFILQKLGAELENAQVAMERLGTETGSATHPAKHDRLEAIASGWSKACDLDSGCGDTGTRPARRDIPEPSEREDGPDSCLYAADGECDEPLLCAVGTDSTDCRISERRRDRDPLDFPPIDPQQLAPARFCVTPAGTCEMIFQVPVGSICTCFTPFGAASGVAQ